MADVCALQCVLKITRKTDRSQKSHANPFLNFRYPDKPFGGGGGGGRGGGRDDKSEYVNTYNPTQIPEDD